MMMDPTGDQVELIGKKYEYDPSMKLPLERQRTRTDFPFLVTLGIYFTVGLAIAIYAFSAGSLGHPSAKSNKILSTNFGPISHRGNKENYNNGSSDNFGNLYGRSHIYIRTVRSLSSNPITETPADIILSVNEASGVIFGLNVLGILLALAYIILLRYHAKFVVYFVIGLIFLAVVAVFSFCTYSYILHETSLELLLAIFSFIIFLIILVIFLVLRKKIVIACEVIKYSSKAVLFFPSTLLFPILPYILYISTFAFCTSVDFYLSMVTSRLYGTSPPHTKLFRFINLFGFLWYTSFVTGFTQMVISGGFVTWYWARNKSDVPNNTIIKSMKITSKYHLGTIALGSLIVALCQVINMMIETLRKIFKGRCSPIAWLCCCGWGCGCGFSCFRTLFKILGKVMNLINTNAYIMSITHGTDFIRSAKDAFYLLMRNIVKCIVIYKITDAILFIGTLLNCIISLLIVFASYGYNDKFWIVGTVIVVCNILISLSFFMVLRTAINTIFLAVLEDFERNDGTEARPYFMNNRLKQLLLTE
ncbi:hypothetical protein TKK_0006444 [Trichogramma kaykai]